jgi:hypothetical protein
VHRALIARPERRNGRAKGTRSQDGPSTMRKAA